MDSAVWRDRGRRGIMFVLRSLLRACQWFYRTKAGTFIFDKLLVWVFIITVVGGAIVAPFVSDVVDMVDDNALVRECKAVHKVESCKIERIAVPVK